MASNSLAGIYPVYRELNAREQNGPLIAIILAQANAYLRVSATLYLGGTVCSVTCICVLLSSRGVQLSSQPILTN